MPLTEEQMLKAGLSVLGRKAERHWRLHLPNLYRGFEEQGNLLKVLRENVKAHGEMMHEMTAIKKLSWSQAEEIVNPMFLFLDPREWDEAPNPDDLLNRLDPPIASGSIPSGRTGE